MESKRKQVCDRDHRRETEERDRERRGRDREGNIDQSMSMCIRQEGRERWRE